MDHYLIIVCLCFRVATATEGSRQKCSSLLCYSGHRSRPEDHKIWHSARSLKGIDEQKELKTPLITASDERHALELRYSVKFREVQCILFSNNRKFVSTLVTGAEAVDNNNDHIRKELTCDCKSFDGPVGDATGRLPIHDDAQLKTWRNHFTTVLTVSHSGKHFSKKLITITC